MTVFEWAMYTFAAERMRPHEKTAALEWAKAADSGDKAAHASLRNLALEVIRTAREREKSEINHEAAKNNERSERVGADSGAGNLPAS